MIDLFAGLWLTTHCQQSLEGSSDLVKCSCYELPYFGLLPVSFMALILAMAKSMVIIISIQEPLSIDIVVLVYVAVVFSSLFLIFVIITIIEAR